MSKEDRIITVGDLVDHIGLPDHIQRPFLRCSTCGSETSANKGDYFNLPVDYAFYCCAEPKKLVIKEVRYIELTPETWQKGK